MKKKAISVLLTVLMVLSCCTAGLSALAAADEAALRSVYETISHASKDKTEEDHNYDDCVALIRDFSAEDLIALGKLSYHDESDAFWWAGDQLVHLYRDYSYGTSASTLRAYCPAVYLDIAQKVPAYADFVSVLLDGVTAYSFLIGEPTATDIALSPEERSPVAIGKRIAELPQGQASALKSNAFFGSGNCLSIEGITENLSEDKAKDESIGAVKKVTDFFGFTFETWETAYRSENVLCNFCLAASFFEQTYAEAEVSLNALSAFADVIEDLKAPYRAADVETAKAAYAAVPSTAWSLADARAKSARETYRAILKANGLNDNAVDLSSYKQTDLGKEELSDKAANELLGLLDSAAGADKKLGDAVASLATGQTLIALLGKLADKNEMLSGMLSIGFISSGLKKDPKFSGAVQKMEALQAEGHTNGFIEYGPDEAGFKTETWSAANQFTSEDFGFADGDFYGFADALGGCFSGLSALLDLVSGFSFKNVTDGDHYIIGKYEDLIPLFELLDLPTPSSAAFTEAEEAMTFTDEEGNAYTDKVRAGINCILKPVADFLMNDFKVAPLDTLIDLLPKAAYAIETGLLNDTVQKLLGSFASLGLKVDLSKDAIWEIVDKKLVSGEEETSMDGSKTRQTDVIYDLDGDNDNEAVPLTKAQFDKLVTDLAGCAQPVVKPSVSIANANRLGLNTQKNKVVSVALAAVLEMEKTEEGKSFIDMLLARLGAPRLASSLLSFAAGHGAGFTFTLLDRFLPILTIILAVVNFFGKVKNLFEK